MFAGHGDDMGRMGIRSWKWKAKREMNEAKLWRRPRLTKD